MIPGILSDEPIDPAAPFDVDLVRDLELDRLLDAMADGDDRVRSVARAVLLSPVCSRTALTRRQEAVAACREHPDAITRLDAIAAGAVAQAHGRDDPLWMLSLHPTAEQRTSHAAARLGRLLPLLDEVRQWCATSGRTLRSAAFRDLVRTVEQTLDDEELSRLCAVQHELTLPGGVLVSAALDGIGEVHATRLHRPRPENRRLLGGAPLRHPDRTYRIPERDQAGFDAAAELTDRSLLRVAGTASDGVAQLDRFFTALHDELGFLLAVDRLRTRLEAVGVELTAPSAAHPVELDAPVRAQVGFRATGLVDPCLALRSGAVPVANDVEVAVDQVLVITGANHGGKSTLLRSIGVAQLMLQSGMPVAARSCSAALVGRVHTHWPRAEDEGLVRGKLDDELARMRAVVDAVAPDDLLLSNESFASTNEREGSAIAFEVVTALAASGVRVALVTHLFDLAVSLERDASTPTTFLRAPRGVDGARSFRLEVGPPLPTSFATDLFDRAFGTALAREPGASAPEEES